ncbi:carboxypeptidase regulatory-like domain-containing protein [Chitinophaga silvatica]|uniref:Carboxypeptidase regulatory-like domain-containing protein n=1 Tax=Chitinophaga silvatica TaxID=2282649 RepID=A0A3E1YHT8_9BACT|nr:carboxypeptidase-like regulatory domain-containing protein [Chitinophaga silvatica]RFS26941.1 carboxypeptidase regulatory-like domain-containing protein [Chitinophaga silvatica]
MRQQLTAGLVALVLLSSCKKDDKKNDNNPGNDSKNPYKVSGIIKDTKGQAIAGAKVRVVNHVLYDVSSDVFSTNYGTYVTPKLDIGGWNIYAWKDITYEGQTYHLRIAPEDNDYNAFSLDKEGYTKNFKLKLSGRIEDVPLSDNSPTTGYYGGTMVFTNLPSEGMQQMPAGTEVKITLTPVAGSKFIDGSEAQFLEKTFTIKKNQFNYFITDIPQCKYKITAKTNGRLILLTDVRDIYGEEPYKESLTYFFKPDPATSYNSGLQSNIETPFFMELF